jgi:hypothetical protein
MTTTNLADFGYRELAMAGELLTAYSENNSFSHFSNDGVQLMMNHNSGNVFLTDSDFNVLMMNGDTLEEFYSSPYEGKEGFFDDLLEEYPDMHKEDREWFRQIADNLGKEITE